ncbi:MAG: tyrosine-type recombinase/integrase [Parcubacteria group bacterium]
MCEFFEPFIDWSIRMGKAESTIKEYRRMFNGPLQTISKIKINKFKMKDVSFAVEAGQQYGKYGEEKAVITLRSLIRFIKENDHEFPIDWRDIKGRKNQRPEVQYLTPGDIETLRTTIDTDSPSGLRTRALFELLLHSGLRIGEAITLDIADIDYDKMEMHIVNCKNKVHQTVFLTDGAVAWLKKYLASRRDTEPCLFISGGGRRLLAVTARASLTKYEKMSGLKKHIHWHLLRKTFVTNLLFGGVDIKTTQHLARHTSEITTLRHYAAINHQEERLLLTNVMANV